MKGILLKLAKALKSIGVEKGESVCGISRNTPEYQCVIQGSMLASTIFVPLYDTLGESAVEFIIQHSKAGVIFTHAQKVDQVRSLV